MVTSASGPFGVDPNDETRLSVSIVFDWSVESELIDAVALGELPTQTPIWGADENEVSCAGGAGTAACRAWPTPRATTKVPMSRQITTRNNGAVRDLRWWPGRVGIR